MSNSISSYKFPGLSFDQTSKLVFVAGGVALALWSFYFPRGNRQMLIQSTDQTSNDGKTGSDSRQQAEVSNQSWLLKENKKWGTKFDLMHKGTVIQRIPCETARCVVRFVLSRFCTTCYSVTVGNAKGGKLVIVMVGIPNRGKTYISRKVARYLRWISYRARVFSLAKYRLDKLGSKPANFFNPANSENTKLRDDLMMTAMEDLIRYLNGGGEIAILDGTNCTKDRRRRIRERVALEDGYEILWLECLKREGVDASVEGNGPVSNQLEMATSDLPDYLKDSPDYMDREDFLTKIRYYENIYEPLEDDEGCSVRIYGSGLDLKLHQIHGYLRTKVASFLMNLHTTPRPVYMTRHGESVFNVKGLIGGGEILHYAALHCTVLHAIVFVPWSVLPFCTILCCFYPCLLLLWCFQIRDCLIAASSFPRHWLGLWRTMRLHTCRQRLYVCGHQRCAALRKPLWVSDASAWLSGGLFVRLKSAYATACPMIR